VANIPEVLVHYRVHHGAVSVRWREAQGRFVDQIRAENPADLGLSADREALALHRRLAGGE
jgi:hypothetical protein